MTTQPPGLRPDHPLLLELASLRTQLSTYQRSSHQTSLALQGSRLELRLVQNENERLQKAVETLKSEVEILRTNPAPAPIPPASTALTELSLAHRRLSAKLDLTEDALRSAQLELASTKQELLRASKEREADKIALRDLRFAQDEWEEGLAWEKGERKRVEEQKKLCDLALAEYAKLVHSLDPSSVPPSSPPRSSTPNILLSTPVLSPSAHAPSDSLDSPISPAPMTPRNAKSAPENISNLLIGQNGVSRLLADSTALLTSRETEIRHLTARVSELESSLSTRDESLRAEIDARIGAEGSRDAVLRDDAAAAKVVERYMTFTQKTHATIHMHLDNLRARSGATTTSLRQENLDLREALAAEVGRGRRIKEAIDELSEGLAREAAGRRREIALRLGMIASEEIRDRKVEKWLDRVRMSRTGAEGAVLDATALGGLLDEGVAAVGRSPAPAEGKRWKVWGKRPQLSEGDANGKAAAEEEGLLRVLLAEELVQSLVQDLGTETDRRMELEKQRVEWLAREALGGAAPSHAPGQSAGGDEAHEEGHEENGGVVFEIGDDDASPRGESPLPDTSGPALLNVDDSTSPLPSPGTGGPLVQELRTIFVRLEERSNPLVKSLHDLSHSLAGIRSSLPSPGAPRGNNSTPLSPIKTKGKFLDLRSRSPLEDPALLSLLEGLHEVIEDARVDLEISRADEERVYRGWEALINVGKSGAVQSGAVIGDAGEYVTQRLESPLYEKLAGRIGDVEGDLAIVKAKIHEVGGAGPITEDEGQGEGKKGIWESLDLKTISTSTWNTRAPSPLGGLPAGVAGVANLVTSPLVPRGGISWGLPSPTGDPAKGNAFATMGNMGRSFSAGVISAPRKVGGLAMAGGTSLRKAVIPGKHTGGVLPRKAEEGAEEGRLLDDDVE